MDTRSAHGGEVKPSLAWDIRASSLSPRRGRQRGAAGLFFALTLFMMVLFLALAVDTGRLLYAQRQLQSIADLAALDAARITGACSGAPTTDPAQVLAAAQAAASARDFLGNPYPGNLAAAPNSVTIGTVSTGADNLRFFTPSGTADARAVQVVLNQPVTRSIFLPALFDYTVNLSADAVAQAPAIARFTLGSFVLNLSSEQSALLNGVLGALLGSNLNLTAVGYQGLAAADVSLLDLIAADAGIGTVEELLAADLTLADLLQLTATALQAENPNAANIILSQILGVGVGVTTAIQLGDLLSLDLPASNAALDAGINVLELITASAQLANEGNFVSVPAVGINLPPVAQVGLDLHVIEAPQLAIGPPGQTGAGAWRTQAQTSQIGLNVRAQALTVTLPLGVLNLSTAATVDLFVQAAQATAHLDSVRCGGLLAPVHQVVVGVQPGVARVGIGRLSDPDDLGSALTPSPTLSLTASVPLLGSTTIAARIAADVPVAGATAQELSYVVDERSASALPETQTVGSDLGAALGNAIGTVVSTLDLDVLAVSGSGVLGSTGGLLNFLGLGSLADLALALLNPLLNTLVTPLLDVLSDVLLEPVLALLGVNLGGADVTLISVEAGQPELVI
jgi:uncharacterized membrane protein